MKEPLAHAVIASLTEQVYALIKENILHLEFEPGKSLVETELAQLLGTSKTPVREALRRLEMEGLVIAVPYKGATVAPLVVEDIREIYEVRAALEALAVRLAIPRLSADQIKELEALLAESELALHQNRLTDCSLCGAQFHSFFVKVADHRRMKAQLDHLASHLERFYRVLEKIPGRLTKSLAEHRTILEAVVCRDMDRACLAVIHHSESFLAEFSKDLERKTEEAKLLTGQFLLKQS